MSNDLYRYRRVAIATKLGMMDVDGYQSNTEPGLIITPAQPGPGWAVTHARSGLSVGFGVLVTFDAAEALLLDLAPCGNWLLDGASAVPEDKRAGLYATVEAHGLTLKSDS